MAWRSIEYRLTAWYSFLLLLTSISIGVILWFGIERSMRSAVDDLLAERLHRLLQFVESEFSSSFSGKGPAATPAELQGTISQITLGDKSFTLGETPIAFDASTTFEGGAGCYGPSLLEVGQFVEVEVVPRNNRLVATRISLEGDAPQELREDLVDYLATITEGNLIQIRSEVDQEVIGAGLPSNYPAVMPWRELHGVAAGYRTVETVQGRYRLLKKKISLLEQPHTVLLASSLEALDSTRDYLVSWALRILPLALLLSFAGGYLISRRALKPVDGVIDLAVKTTTHNLSGRLPVDATGGVIQRLTSAFNDMLNRLEASVSKLEHFTADASHELRTPISVIRTTAELALRHARTEQAYRRDLAEIQAEAERLTELIEDLLTLARADAGGTSFSMSRLDLSAAVGNGCDHLQGLVQQRGLKLERDIPQEAVAIQGHGPSLQRMLTNVLENAAEHTPRGGSIRVLLETSQSRARLRIRDTGQGIRPEDLSRIFDRFYRADHSRSRSGGAGLGLSIARWIAQQHGARITVESQVGQGSEFTIIFPLSPGSDNQ